MIKSHRNAAEWLWKGRGRNLWLLPSVLTSQNVNDPNAPKLTEVEAESLFRLLEEKGLIFRTALQDGSSVLSIHETKEKEWEHFLWSHNPIYLWIFRPLERLLGISWKVIVFLLGAIITVIIGYIFKS